MKVEPRCLIKSLDRRRTPEDADAEASIKVKFKEWHAHWQVGAEVHEQEKLWESMELRKEEEAFAPLRVGARRRSAAADKSITEWELTDSMRGYQLICRMNAVVDTHAAP